jgi:hypothetical protein
MTTSELRGLTDAELAAHYEALRNEPGRPSQERVETETELGRRVRRAGVLHLEDHTYRWDDEGDSFCRLPRVGPKPRTQNGRPGVPSGPRLGRLATGGAIRTAGATQQGFRDVFERNH